MGRHAVEISLPCKTPRDLAVLDGLVLALVRKLMQHMGGYLCKGVGACLQDGSMQYLSLPVCSVRRNNL